MPALPRPLGLTSKTAPMQRKILRSGSECKPIATSTPETRFVAPAPPGAHLPVAARRTRCSARLAPFCASWRARSTPTRGAAWVLPPGGSREGRWEGLRSSRDFLSDGETHEYPAGRGSRGAPALLQIWDRQSPRKWDVKSPAVIRLGPRPLAVSQGARDSLPWNVSKFGMTKSAPEGGRGETRRAMRFGVQLLSSPVVRALWEPSRPRQGLSALSPLR